MTNQVDRCRTVRAPSLVVEVVVAVVVVVGIGSVVGTVVAVAEGVVEVVEDKDLLSEPRAAVVRMAQAKMADIRQETEGGYSVAVVLFAALVEV